MAQNLAEIVILPEAPPFCIVCDWLPSGRTRAKSLEIVTSKSRISQDVVNLKS